MSSLGEQIRSRVDRRAKKIEVSEWGEGDEPVVLYFYPLTIEDAKKLNSYLKGKGSKSREDEYVYYLIFNARDAHGDLVFDLEDVEWLSNQPVSVITDIYLQANLERQGFDETLKK